MIRLVEAEPECHGRPDHRFSLDQGKQLFWVVSAGEILMFKTFHAGVGSHFMLVAHINLASGVITH